MQRVLFGLGLLLVQSAVSAYTGKGDITVDDSYSPGQRWVANKPTHPELEWPILAFQSGQQVEFERPYKSLEHRDLHLDIFYPAPEARNGRAIIFVHGGGWRSGNKSHFYPLANLMAQRGYTVITPEYRLSVQAPYPAALEDVNDAIFWVKAHSEQLKINPDKIAVSGGSSGGHMAALLGHANPRGVFNSVTATDTRVNAVIDLDGVLDFTTPLALSFENRKKAQSAAGLWLGGAYEDIPDIWKQASPAYYAGKESPPTLIISSGQLRFTAGRENLQATLDQYGILNQYIEQEETLHTFWLFEPYLTQTAQWIDTFLERVEQQGKQQ